MGSPWRGLPGVDRVADALGSDAPHPLRVDAARRAIGEARAAIGAGEEAPAHDMIVDRARSLLASGDRARLHSVINATGVMIHTNLGRVPLGPEQMEAVAHVATGYSNLEFDIDTGRRGSRYALAADSINALTGAEAALVVNNNAAGVLLTLAALCSGKEVIVSRGELVEIGGEFRIPDVMSASGAQLVEVGTTNRTHLSDYERAIGSNTAAIMRVHPSNYRMVGFTASVPSRELARLSAGRKIFFLHDIGSGLVSDREASWANPEPPAEVAIADGADVVMFSGDKLLGGPQAGLIAGRKSLVAKIAKHPLLRALRVDKMTLAALASTLAAHLEGRAASLPLYRMASQSPDELEARARALAAQLADLEALGTKVEARPTLSVSGGGSLAGADMPSWGVSLDHPERSVSALAESLRHTPQAVVGRIEEDRLILDLRTVAPSDDSKIAAALRAALESGNQR